MGDGKVTKVSSAAFMEASLLASPHLHHTIATSAEIRRWLGARLAELGEGGGAGRVTLTHVPMLAEFLPRTGDAEKVLFDTFGHPRLIRRPAGAVVSFGPNGCDRDA
eukprot:3625716-Pyramimonas_sp.AAC.1